MSEIIFQWLGILFDRILGKRSDMSGLGTRLILLTMQ